MEQLAKQNHNIKQQPQTAVLNKNCKYRSLVFTILNAYREPSSKSSKGTSIQYLVTEKPTFTPRLSFTILVSLKTLSSTAVLALQRRTLTANGQVHI